MSKKGRESSNKITKGCAKDILLEGNVLNGKGWKNVERMSVLDIKGIKFQSQLIMFTSELQKNCLKGSENERGKLKILKSSDDISHSFFTKDVEATE